MTVFERDSDVLLNRRTGLLSFDMIKTWFNKALSELELSMLDNGVDALDLTCFDDLDTKEAQSRLLTCLFFAKLPPTSVALVFEWVEEHLELPVDILARNACFSGELFWVTKYLSSLTDEQINVVFRADNALIINELSRQGQLAVINCLFSENLSHGEALRTTFTISHFQRFIEIAIKNKHVDVVKYLFKQLEAKEKKQVIQSNDYKLFFLGVDEGGFEITRLLLRQLLTQEEKKSAITALNHKAILSASLNCNPILLRCLLMQFNAFEVNNILLFNDFEVLRKASYGGAFECFNYLLSRLSALEKKQALRACYEKAFGMVILMGAVDTLWLFDSALEQEEKKALSVSNDYRYLRDAIAFSQFEITHYLLCQALNRPSTSKELLALLGMRSDKIQVLSLCIDECERTYQAVNRGQKARTIICYLKSQLIGEEGGEAKSLNERLTAVEKTMRQEEHQATASPKVQTKQALSNATDLFFSPKSKAIKLPIEDKSSDFEWTKQWG